MAIQSSRNIRVAYKPESTFNTPPGATGATQFRANPGSGLSLSRQNIASNEIRSDLKTTMSRLGSKEVKGSYSGDLSVGTFDPLLEAALRGTWSSVLTLAAANFTSITTTASTIVAAGGSWLTMGVMIGDVIRIAGSATTGNNNRNLRVTNVTATTITVAEVLTANATADTGATITRSKKLVQPSIAVRRSFTFEESDQDIGASEQYTGCRVSALKLTGKPNQIIDVEFTIVGADLTVLTGGASPYYTAPTLTSTLGLVMSDAQIRAGGSDVVNLTSFDVMLDLKAATQPVVGSMTSPDVFDNAATVSGSFSATRKDMAYLSNFIAETELQMQVLMGEPTGNPASFINLFIPRVKIGGSTKNFGSDGAMITTHPFIVGAQDGSVTGLDNSMLTLQTSAA